MAELLKKIPTETLLEKIPAEKCWAITAKYLARHIVVRMMKTNCVFLGKGDEIYLLLSAWDKEVELKAEVWGGGAKQLFPFLKETFNIPVEDAIGAEKLAFIAWTLCFGPEWKVEIVEATPERVVVRPITCPVWDLFIEFAVDPSLIPCPGGHQPFCERGLKAVDPKLTFKLTKAMPWGDSYCKLVFEFKEE